MGQETKPSDEAPCSAKTRSAVDQRVRGRGLFSGAGFDRMVTRQWSDSAALFGGDRERAQGLGVVAKDARPSLVCRSMNDSITMGFHARLPSGRSDSSEVARLRSVLSLSGGESKIALIEAAGRLRKSLALHGHPDSLCASCFSALLAVFSLLRTGVMRGNGQ